jgi:hypothetical protein
MRGDIGPRDELYMVDPEGKLDKMDKDEHHLEYLMNFYPDEEDYNEDFWDVVFDGGWIRIELRENHTNGWNLNLNGKSLYRMKAIVRDKFLERLKRGENKVHIEEWTGTGMNPTHIFYLPAQKHELFDFLFEKLKAKFINEVLNFERGINPKDSMDIGNKSARKLQEFYDFIKEKNIFRIGEITKQPSFTFFYTPIASTPGFYVKSIISKDPNEEDKFTYHSYNEDDRFLGSRDFKNLAELKSILKSRLGILESINFERGLEPKESMGIGTEAQKKKIDKETDWGFEFSHAFQVRTYDIIKYEGFLIKIVQVMGSDGIAYYATLNNTGEPYNNTPPLYNTPEEALDWEKKYIDQYNMGL